MLLYQTEIVTILNKALNQTAKIRKGTDAVYHCPVCKHYKKKLEINLLSGKYHCWVCGFSGTSIKTLFKKLGLSSSYLGQIYKNTQGLKKVKSDEIDNILNSFCNEPVSEEPPLFLPKEFKPFFGDDISLTGKHALKYLKRRGITKYDILRYNIGYCEEGQYKHRVLIPSYNKQGKLNFFSTRSIFENTKMKYVNSTASKNIIGFEMFLDYNLPLNLVEGVFDAIAIRNNAIPLFGKSLSKNLKYAITFNRVSKVNVILDNDALEDSIKICEFLLKNGVETKLIKLDGKDPSEIGFEKTWDIINSTCKLDFQSLFKLKVTV